LNAPESSAEVARSRSRWIAVSLVVAAGFAVLAGVGFAFEDAFLTEALRRYEAPQWRRDLLRVRLENYAAFYAIASGVCVAFAAVLHRVRAAPPGAGDLPRAAFALAVAVASIGMFAISTAEWERFDRPCWDGYCDYATRFREVIFRPDETGSDRLRAFMRGNYHANSPAGPLLTALVSGTSGLRTVSAYRVVVGLATLAAIACAWWGLLLRVRVSEAARAAALALIVSNLIVIRSSLFPQTDALVLCWTTALLAVCWLRWTRPSAWHSVACFLLLLTGSFVKLSFLPALALWPLWLLAVRLWPAHSAPRPSWTQIVREGCVYALIPAAVYVGFQRWAGTAERFSDELNRTSTEDTLLVFAAMSLLHAALFAGGLIALGWRRLGAFEALLLGWAALYLVSLWASGASGWDRFYLPIVPALCVVAARGLEEIARAFGRVAMWSAVAGIAALNYAALGLQLYY
jgi:hypothetical protein